MSTRCIIARPTAEGFSGVYVARDGYPSGVGEALNLFYRFAADNLTELLREVIDEHPHGIRDMGPNSLAIEGYAGGDGLLTQDEAAVSGAEYVYLLHRDGGQDVMDILARVYGDWPVDGGLPPSRWVKRQRVRLAQCHDWEFWQALDQQEETSHVK